MSISSSIPDDPTCPGSPPVGLLFFDKKTETLWVQTHVPELVRAIGRSSLMQGEGQLVRSPMPDGVKIGGGETCFRMLFLDPLPADLEFKLTREQREIRRIVFGLGSVLRKRAKVTRLGYLFQELLHSPILQF